MFKRVALQLFLAARFAFLFRKNIGHFLSLGILLFSFSSIAQTTEVKLSSGKKAAPVKSDGEVASDQSNEEAKQDKPESDKSDGQDRADSLTENGQQNSEVSESQKLINPTEIKKQAVHDKIKPFLPKPDHFIQPEKICPTPFLLSQAEIRDEESIVVKCAVPLWKPTDLVVLKNKKHAVVALLQVEKQTDTQNDLKLIMIREDRIPQASDYFSRLDLSLADKELKGTSYLWKTPILPKETQNLYRPLYTQGTTIGETAHTLRKKEYYFTALGTIAYGIENDLTAGASITAWALGAPNGKVKGRVYQSDTQTWSVSLSMAQERNSSERLFNVDLIWDSILADNFVAHSLISAAVISFDSAKDAAALKSYGSSSIQTGYEYIFSDWSRFLVGPSYNLDQKALGGYIGYVKIINNLHLQASLTTNNVREMKFSAKEGYFFILDAYWRW